MRKHLRTLLAAAALCASSQAWATPPPVEPLPFFNQNPLILVYGLPTARGPQILPNGAQRLALNLDFTSHFVNRAGGGEAIILDGETTRLGLTYRRGLAQGLEASIELPFIDHSAGFADSAIDEFHDITGFSDGGRSKGPDKRQLYQYRRDGRTLLQVDDGPSGLGDLRLGLSKALQLEGATSASISAQLELPTGDADELTGSESVDFATWLTLGRADVLFTGFSVVGAAGGLYTSRGEVLPQQRQRAAGFGWLTLGYGWTPRFTLKAQLYVHSALYENSRLEAVDAVAVQGALGFAWHFAQATRMDLSIVEDLNQDASPDVSFNLSLRQGF